MYHFLNLPPSLPLSLSFSSLPSSLPSFLSSFPSFLPYFSCLLLLSFLPRGCCGNSVYIYIYIYMYVLYLIPNKCFFDTSYPYPRSLSDFNRACITSQPGALQDVMQVRLGERPQKLLGRPWKPHLQTTKPAPGLKNCRTKSVRTTLTPWLKPVLSWYLYGESSETRFLGGAGFCP